MRITLVLSLCLLAFLGKTQQPAVGAMTVIPMQPSQNSFLRIATTVTTPAQGVLVDKTFTVTQNPNRIELRICYGYGLLPATFTYVDTFNVGMLPAGNYSVHFRAYMSSANQWCNKIDSNEVSSTLTVNITTSLSDGSKSVRKIYVAEGGKKLNYNCGNETINITIYSLTGAAEVSFLITGTGSKELPNLNTGLYYICYGDGEKLRTMKFIKE